MDISRYLRSSSLGSVRQRLFNSSASRISANTKAKLLNFLSVLGPSVVVWADNAEVVAAVMQLKADMQSGSISMEGGCGARTITPSLLVICLTLYNV